MIPFETIPLPKDMPRPPETVLVNVTPQETRVAILEEQNICELHIERNREHSLVGNIYLGVVRRVLPGMQSAFIDIGLERAAFLHIMDVVEQRQNPESNQRIEHVLFEGKTVLVQVIKDPINSKGARLSTQISLAGRFLVHLPQDEHIGISQRIEGEEERNGLRERLNNLLPENACHGYIIRTSAETATDAELQADIDYLTKVWSNIKNQAKVSPPETLLYADLPLVLRVLRDMFNDNTREILVDSRMNFERMQQFAALYVQNASEKIQRFRSERPLFETYGIESEINRALQPRVNLNFGSYLIIETTEAMTTIDVNTGGFVGAKNFDETIFKTNLEACHAIARELRLRNLGGIIIIDFIDMVLPEHREAVLQELAKALSFDRTRVTLNGFTSLGLVELTRKRSRESLKHVLCEPCHVCQGRGSLKTPQTLCYEIQREIVRESRRFEVREFRIIASPKVIDLFLDEESQSLAMLIDFIGKPISLSVETEYTQEQYDIVLV
ncbi:Rne/Rng family ribonuclease [Kingella negevensis]|uniref:Rne/Rng family ribonuclease n=1 Tax=Kingella negevensis TaxID=1522312 RepID=UPI00254FAC55|nr:Rne/Rng family ribonuclease [Kingella negevensis]MDK4680720.1 Rne/Rng family ribonuclease [Kingella negevensis]MDK4681557.1 Rne/Rng family ribonuclease [Kingella negevensis]MDK4691944.1 Rne/Rng family ribonuclease [Kingella negevensis]MDK4692903.1 Rne/Rng family ribonuclease [Kingella negevensis]MDK4699202.1 Rne/Rng family ribonuclease [Kingella negevensis]